ncbi:MAG TPA: hypothetical protein VFO34_08205 [Candidatus Acidoferrales bacterium]|nr:hypothetical protein [Candidatus Acidoferrales bacterium]
MSKSALFCAAVFIMSSVGVTRARAQDPREAVDVDNVTRSYVVHVPKYFDKTKKYPAVLLLHPMDNDGDDMARLTHFNETADANNFIAVYPNALGRRWDLGAQQQAERPRQRNGGYGRGGGGWPGGGWPGGGGGGGGQRRGGGQRPSGGEEAQHGNDLAFFDRVLDKVEFDYPVDPTRVYVVGLSDGGVMDFRLGCLMSERIAAIATVGAELPEPLSKSCLPSHSIPLMMVNGTSDPIFHYKGGDDRQLRLTTLSAEDSAKAWAKISSCGEKSKQSSIPPIVSGDKPVRLDEFTDCKPAPNVRVVLYSLEGSGNTWPRGEQYEPESKVGKVSGDFETNESIWKFLEGYTLPTATARTGGNN